MRLFFLPAFTIMFLRVFSEDGLQGPKLRAQIQLAMCQARCNEQMQLDSACSSSECQECDVQVFVNETNNLCNCDYSDGCSEMCRCFQEETLQDLPFLGLSSPQLVCKDLLQDINETESILYMKWTITNQTLDIKPVTYVLEISACDKPNWAILGKGKFSIVPIRGLRMNTGYQFRVTAVLPEGYVGPSAASECITTIRDAAPWQPLNISVSNTYLTDDGKLNALIKWIPSSDLPCYYEVIWYEETLDSAYQLLKLTPEQPSLNQVVIDKLRFGTNYTVIVTSGLDGMKYESKKSHLWFVTENCTQIYGHNFTICAPSPPTDLKYQLLPNSNGNLTVALTWKPPTHTSKQNQVLQYRVKLRKHINFVGGSLSVPFSKEIIIAGNVLQTIVRDLEPEDYEFSVTAISQGGESDPEPTKTIIRGRPKEDSGFLTGTLLVLLPSLFGVAVLVIGILALFRFQRNQKQKKARNRYFESLEEVAPSAEDELTLEDLRANEDFYELDLTYFCLGEILGQGAFGVVRRAQIRYHNTWEIVAIKMLKPSASEEDRRQLLQEIEILRSVGQHPHIISFIGCCIKGNQPFVAVEHCPLGDLQSYLRHFRPQYLTVDPLYESDGSAGANNDSGFANNWSGVPYAENEEIENSLRNSITNCEAESIHFYQNIYHQTKPDLPQITSQDPFLQPTDLLSFSRQIALGMEYLSKNKLIHRDLATRNILVCENKIVKISDFGLSRDVYENNIYNKTTAGRLPVKWMAYESLFDHTYTTKSDVWSFGVVLWELATLGGTPYPGVSNEELFKLLRTGYRMEKPDNCSDDVYALMRCCWQERPQMRPSFTELRHRLEVLLEDSIQYITFDIDVNAEYYNTSDTASKKEKLGTTEDDSAFGEDQ